MAEAVPSADPDGRRVEGQAVVDEQLATGLTCACRLRRSNWRRPTKIYAASDFEKGQAALADVVAYSELARDYAIQSHKYQKQIEIAVRAMARKLTELMHSLGHDDQAPVQDAINRLQRVRDDLLMAMFPKGAK